MIKALVLTGDGINCEGETAFALSLAGAETECCHVNALLENPKRLDQVQILALPGGFSFGDEVSSGKILAIKLRHVLGDTLQRFIERQNLVVGICNGFQTLVKLGLLPQSERFIQHVTLTHNRQRRFINRWVAVKTPVRKSLFLEGLEDFMLPIRHGEGRLMVPRGEELYWQDSLQSHIALTYADDVNGSFLQIAGLVNESGTVLGLMPHPEVFVRWTQHPSWTSLPESCHAETPPGLRLFQNMVQRG